MQLQAPHHEEARVGARRPLWHRSQPAEAPHMKGLPPALRQHAAAERQGPPATAHGATAGYRGAGTQMHSVHCGRGVGMEPVPLPPCVTFRRVVAPSRGPGQSPVLPFACCVGSLLVVGVLVVVLVVAGVV